MLIHSDDVIKAGIKLKDYLQEGLQEISDDYIKVSNDDTINVCDALEYIRKYRNILLCINEICKSRKKY